MDSKFFNGKNCLKKLLMYALYFISNYLREIHYKELALAILEAGECQDLQGELSARDPRKQMV